MDRQTAAAGPWLPAYPCRGRTPLAERIGRRQRAAHPDGASTFAVDYQVCRGGRLGRSEKPQTLPQHRRYGPATARPPAVGADHPDLSWPTHGGQFTDSRAFEAAVGPGVPADYQGTPEPNGTPPTPAGTPSGPVSRWRDLVAAFGAPAGHNAPPSRSSAYGRSRAAGEAEARDVRQEVREGWRSQAEVLAVNRCRAVCRETPGAMMIWFQDRPLARARSTAWRSRSWTARPVAEVAAMWVRSSVFSLWAVSGRGHRPARRTGLRIVGVEAARARGAQEPGGLGNVQLAPLLDRTTTQ